MLRTRQFMRCLAKENDKIEAHLNNSFLISQMWALMQQSKHKVAWGINLEYLGNSYCQQRGSPSLSLTVATLSATDKSGAISSFGKILSADQIEGREERGTKSDQTRLSSAKIKVTPTKLFLKSLTNQHCHYQSHPLE